MAASDIDAITSDAGSGDGDGAGVQVNVQHGSPLFSCGGSQAQESMGV